MTKTTVNGLPIQYDRVPVDYMADGLQRYIEHGVPPGSFMTAVLCNDLMDAAGRADDTNRRYLFEWAGWLYNYAPPACYGSPEKVKAWIESRRSGEDKQ